VKNVDNPVIDNKYHFGHLSACCFRLCRFIDALSYRESFFLVRDRRIIAMDVSLAILGTENCLVFAQ